MRPTITIAPARCRQADTLRRMAEWIVDHGGTIAADDSELLGAVASVLRERGLDNFEFDCGDDPARKADCIDLDMIGLYLSRNILPPWRDTPEARLATIKTQAREAFFEIEGLAASKPIDEEFRPSEAKHIRQKLANIAMRFDWLAGEGFDWPFRKEAYAE